MEELLCVFIQAVRDALGTSFPPVMEELRVLQEKCMKEDLNYRVIENVSLEIIPS